MLTYEQITHKFITAARIAGLEVYNIEHKIEILTCKREFQCCCTLPNGLPGINATVGFHWPAINIIESRNLSDKWLIDGAPRSFDLNIKYCYFECLTGTDNLEKVDKLNKDLNELQQYLQNLGTVSGLGPVSQCESFFGGNQKLIRSMWSHSNKSINLGKPVDFEYICREIHLWLEEVGKLSFFTEAE